MSTAKIQALVAAKQIEAMALNIRGLNMVGREGNDHYINYIDQRLNSLASEIEELVKELE